MKKLGLALALVLLASPVAAQPGIGGIAARAFPVQSTVAGLPAAGGAAHGLRIVTDGASATDCAVGGGSTILLCLDTGAAWVAVGGSGAASDVSCTDCVTLGTETAGGYAASVSEGGPATTATALAANGANCSAGSYPLGVDASGAVEGCTADDTGTDDQTAAEVPYTPTTGADWTDPDPTDAGGGLDALAARLAVEEAKADDDVPESGDFGAAVDLEADGSLSNDTVGLAELAACAGPDEIVEYGASGVPSCIATPGGGGIDPLVVDPDDGSVTTTAIATDFATPVVWLDAEQDDANLNDNDAVATATNYGSGGNFTQGTGTAQPTFKTGILNSKPVYRFDGGDCLTNSSVALSTFSTFFVFRASVNGLLYEHSADVGSNDGSFLYTDQNSSTRVKRGGVDSARDIGVSWGSRGQWLVVTQSFGGTFATHRVKVDGGWVLNTTVGTANDPGTGTATTELNIGCRNEASAFVTGDIAEVLIYSPRLSAAQERAVLLYLQTKYDL